MNNRATSSLAANSRGSNRNQTKARAKRLFKRLKTGDRVSMILDYGSPSLFFGRVTERDEHSCTIIWQSGKLRTWGRFGEDSDIWGDIVKEPHR